ncbi:uncharacterized protein N7518_010135 [Penicillium psychrosexuale]|uniref:uncharacterized protein n=1 Tax=Penicillium psychrosexuale TaxID=1002107 RepID=UPI0025454D3C|nr:uncharacterized protein N7518_010135 [Penicillium psychrosexuale]KAJ5781652.1 hypothetical protein N7518_010135 [Penicillium psychrosexuale]
MWISIIPSPGGYASSTDAFPEYKVPGGNIEAENEPRDDYWGSEAGSDIVENLGDEEDEEEDEEENENLENEFDDEIENSEYEPTTKWAAGRLKDTQKDEPPKDQDKLRKIARSEGLHHLGLRCPGSGRVIEGLVLGMPCPNSTTITFQTGVFYRHHRAKHIGLKCRCAPCNGRFVFNEFLRSNFLEADDKQTLCCHKSCFKLTWEGSRFCQKHFLAWTPELLVYDEAAMKELRSMFDAVASQQWRPETEIMANLIRRMESDSEADIPPSYLVNIDLECGFRSKEVLEIGLADIEGKGVLNCTTKYSDGIIAPSSSSPAPLTHSQMSYDKKVRMYIASDGRLRAKQVVKKLQEVGISNKTFFLAWASWRFDLIYVRQWLQQEGLSGVLPGDENVCLLFQEFRTNVRRVLGRTCFKGRSFPLKLPLLFVLLFGDTHPLAGRNHRALVDAQQLALLARLFIDLCKPPSRRVYWRASTLKMPFPGKRQQKLDLFFPPSKRRKLS